jgi:hypothetical protein
MKQKSLRQKTLIFLSIVLIAASTYTVFCYLDDSVNPELVKLGMTQDEVETALKRQADREGLGFNPEAFGPIPDDDDELTLPTCDRVLVWKTSEFWLNVYFKKGYVVHFDTEEPQDGGFWGRFVRRVGQ